MRALRFAIATLLVPTAAFAESPRERTSSLSWVRMPGADACVSTQDLARQVEARLGHPVFVSAAAAEVSVEGRVEPVAKRGFRAVITLRDAHGVLLGTRELAHPEATCGGMTESLALVIALMIDPDAATRASPAPAPAPAPAPEPVIIERPLYVPVVVAPPEKPVWRIDVGVSAATSLGLVDAPDVGLAASVLLQPPRFFPLEGFGALWLDKAGSLSLGYVGGGLCPLHSEAERVRVAACAMGEIGLFANPRAAVDDSALYLAGGIDGHASVRIVGPFAARAGLSGVIPLFRTETKDGENVFRPSPVAGALDLGLGVVLP